MELRMRVKRFMDLAKNLEIQCTAKDAQLLQKDKIIAERDEELREKYNELAEKDKDIFTKNQDIRAKEFELEQLTTARDLFLACTLAAIV